MTLNASNNIEHHVAVALGSAVFAAFLWAVGYEVGRIVGAVPWFLLFLVMVIGPLVRIRPSVTKLAEGNFPVTWRAELGIWFVLWSILHLGVVFHERNWEVVAYLTGMSPWAFGAFVALVLGFLLLFTSNQRAFRYLGPKAWKWHQSHATYVIFWLVAVHGYDRAYNRPGFPSDEPLHWAYLVTIAVVFVLHLTAFAVVVSRSRKKGKEPKEMT